MSLHSYYNVLNHRFTRSKSTTGAVTEQMTCVYGNFDKENIVISSFLDFSEPFDCIDQEILSNKLTVYVRGTWYGS